MTEAERKSTWLDGYGAGRRDAASVAAGPSVAALREALAAIFRYSYDEHDECRWCGTEIDEGHDAECPAAIAYAALAAAPSPAPTPDLDEERLARVLSILRIPYGEDPPFYIEQAKDIAAEYRRLGRFPTRSAVKIAVVGDEPEGSEG